MLGFRIVVVKYSKEECSIIRQVKCVLRLICLVCCLLGTTGRSSKYFERSCRRLGKQNARYGQQVNLQWRGGTLNL